MNDKQVAQENIWKKDNKKRTKTTHGGDSQSVLFHIDRNVNMQDELGICNWKINKVLIRFYKGKFFLENVGKDGRILICDLKK